MRLTDDHLKAGWLHPRRVVRNAVAWHFTEALTTDPDVTAHAIRGAREFGWDQFLTWPHVLATLPLADDAAFEWVCGEVERTDEASPSENLKGHLARMLVKAEIGLVERHRARLLAIPGLRPRERQTLITRLDLAMCAPDEAWRLLDDHCRMAAAGRTFADAKIEHAQLLLEPLERAGGETAARVMEVLASPPPDTGGDDPGDWLAGFMVALAGRLRLEEAAAAILDLAAIDWDWYDDESIAALTRIGTPGVVRLIQDRYPEEDWPVRMSAARVWTRIRCDESATAIEEALRLEDDEDLRCHLGVAAAGQFDDRLVPLAVAVFNEGPIDPERSDIREPLVAWSHLSGHDLPDRDEWERDIDELDDRLRKLGDPTASPLADVVRGMLEGRHDEDEADDVDLGAWGDDHDYDDDSAASVLERGSQIGRNEPCSCGSGKKYKRCCLRDTPG